MLNSAVYKSLQPLSVYIENGNFITIFFAACDKYLVFGIYGYSGRIFNGFIFENLAGFLTGLDRGLL